MNRDRLNFLAAELRKNASNPTGTKFDLNSWADKVDTVNPLSCGTTACAFGFAALLPEFQEQGLMMINGLPTYGNAIGFKAAAKFFDIPDAVAWYVFSQDSYHESLTHGAAGEHAVATRIQSILIAGGL